LENGKTCLCDLKHSVPDNTQLKTIEEPNFKRSLFSKGVILCEGSTEFFTVPILLRKLNLNLEDNEIELINMRSDSGFNKYIDIYEKSKIPWVVVGDKKAKMSIEPLLFNTNENKIHLFPEDDLGEYLARSFEDIFNEIHPNQYGEWKKGNLKKVSVDVCIDIAEKATSKDIEKVQGLTELKDRINTNLINQ